MLSDEFDTNDGLEIWISEEAQPAPSLFYSKHSKLSRHISGLHVYFLTPQRLIWRFAVLMHFSLLAVMMHSSLLTISFF